MKKYDIIMVVMYNNVGIKMKLKKYIGGFLFMLVGVFVNLNPASAFTVGAEEMPESMKNLR